MIEYNPDPIKYSLWLKKYKPVLDKDGSPQAYETYESENYEYDSVQMRKRIKDFTDGDDSKSFLHVWTEVDADSGEETILINGFRRVNRIQYFITEVPFAETVNDGIKLYQEVHDG